MEISELIHKAHENAYSKGFWSQELAVVSKMKAYDNLFSSEEVNGVINAFRSQRLMLIVSELTEALEALRKSDWPNYKEELADVMIRMGDLAGGEDIRLEKEITNKMHQNEQRPYLHGKEF